MGHKIHPQSLRRNIVVDWPARWFFGIKGRTSGEGKYPYARFLAEDELIRKIIKEKIGQAGIATVGIDRTLNSLRIIIKAARPGFIIGRGGKGIEELTKTLENEIGKFRKEKGKVGLSLNIEELKRSEVAAPYVAQQIAWDLEKRLPFRRTIKKYLDQVMQNREVKGVKILLAGRLDGTEIARREFLKAGLLPLQTLRANIDYGQATAFTIYGTVGVKVWLYKGEVFAKQTENNRNK